VRLWRISNYADLSGLGGLRFSARWHTRGRPVIYAAEHPAGALAEFLAHLDLDDMPERFQLLTIEAAAGAKSASLDPASLPRSWKRNLNATRAAGDRWLAEGRSLLLRVPSALVPEAFNVLINPLHPHISKLKIVNKARVPLDSRFAR
jgi:RES domain-containing protein